MTSPRRSFPARAKRAAALAANLLAPPLVRRLPRRATRWAFGGKEGLFAGNPKYLFLWMSIHRPDLDIAWISPDEAGARALRAHGLRAYARNAPAGLRHALSAGVFVFGHAVNDVNLRASFGAYLLNLWHGVGIKTVMFGDAGGAMAKALRESETTLGRARNLGAVMPPDALATTSDFMQAHFADQFRLPPARCPQLGYPRLDCEADPALKARALAIDRAAGFALNPDGFAETYIYMPTFRDTARPFVDDAFPSLERLSDALAARHAQLYVKLHMRTAATLPPLPDNIRIWPAAIDFHTYLGDFTGLITDYSSVLYDYLFVRDAGAILYTFDYDAYIANDRSLLYPFEENVAGLIVADFDALCAALRSGAALARPPRLDTVRSRFWGGQPRPASARIVEFVERQRAPAGPA